MKSLSRDFYNNIYAITLVAVLIIISFYGKSFYQTDIIERPFHSNYEAFKPSGIISHGFGIAGASLIFLGILVYSLRKRWKKVKNIGKLPYWLDFHMFLCTMGTILALFHTTFKFGGIISIGFWSLALVWISGIVGRFIYIRIPRSIKGNELTLKEILSEKERIDLELQLKYKFQYSLFQNENFYQIWTNLSNENKNIQEFIHLNKLIRKEKKLIFSIRNLTILKKWLGYWHKVHINLTFVFITILMIHIGVAIFFGYNWLLS